MNRCLSEGRRAFFERLEGIEAGAECARLEPLLSALADGEAGADELSALRPHLKTCLTCRARLREYRAAPTRVAALVPPALVAASDGHGGLRSLVESIVGATHDKAAALGERAHAAAEVATGQKLAAVAASAAALAGGGAGVEQLANGGPEGPPQPAARAEPVKQEVAAPAPPEPAPQAAPAPAAEPAPQPEPEAPPDPANEFTPGPVTPAQAAAPQPTPTAAGTLAPGGSAGGGGRGGEFGP